jgi:hypothetical protein
MDKLWLGAIVVSFFAFVLTKFRKPPRHLPK